jgi:hypothetical protein
MYLQKKLFVVVIEPRFAFLIQHVVITRADEFLINKGISN